MIAQKKGAVSMIWMRGSETCRARIVLNEIPDWFIIKPKIVARIGRHNPIIAPILAYLMLLESGRFNISIYDHLQLIPST
jgi:hypothetical protein